MTITTQLLLTAFGSFVSTVAILLAFVSVWLCLAFVVLSLLGARYICDRLAEAEAVRYVISKRKQEKSVI